MNRILNPLRTALVTAVGGVALVIALEFSPMGGTALAAPQEHALPKLQVEDAPLKREIKASTSFAPVVKRVAPSVVNIYSTMIVRERPNPFMSDPFWRYFFGEQFGQDSTPRERKAQSLGSGVIVSADGYILTANHVVDGAESVKVALPGGDRFDAKIIGTDPPTDVAVLKIEAKKSLPVITIADSDKLEVGDVVLAIGNPFEVGETVTMGIVSAVGRGGYGVSGYENFIQTDAAINPGNSGGPLVDAEGRLVGINTWIVSRTGGFQGVGFAVPVNIARYAMEHLIKEGKVTRGYLGLRLQPESELTQEVAKEFKLPDLNGALVTAVEPNSPAAKAGFKDGDFITELNGKKVANMRQLRLMVSETAPGTKVSLKYLRDGAEKTVNVTLAAMPEDLMTRRGRGQPGQRNPSAMDALDGVEVSDIDAEARRQMGLPNNVRGALVTNVDSDSNAADAGLRQGDVIVEINRQAVHSADEAVTLSEKARTERILLRVWRGSGDGGGFYYLSVDNTKRK